MAVTLTQASRPSVVAKGRQNNKGHSFEDQWLNEYYDSLPTPSRFKKPPIEDYRDAYRFGKRSRVHNRAAYSQIEDILQATWNDLIGVSVLSWDEAQPIVQYAYAQGYGQGHRHDVDSNGASLITH